MGEAGVPPFERKMLIATGAGLPRVEAELLPGGWRVF
jgi:hypothetical protein